MSSKNKKSTRARSAATFVIAPAAAFICTMLPSCRTTEGARKPDAYNVLRPWPANVNSTIESSTASRANQNDASRHAREVMTRRANRTQQALLLYDGRIGTASLHTDDATLNIYGIPGTPDKIYLNQYLPKSVQPLAFLRLDESGTILMSGTDTDRGDGVLIIFNVTLTPEQSFVVWRSSLFTTPISICRMFGKPYGVAVLDASKPSVVSVDLAAGVEKVIATEHDASALAQAQYIRCDSADRLSDLDDLVCIPGIGFFYQLTQCAPEDLAYGKLADGPSVLFVDGDGDGVIDRIY